MGFLAPQASTYATCVDVDSVWTKPNKAQTEQTGTCCATHSFSRKRRFTAIYWVPTCLSDVRLAFTGFEYTVVVEDEQDEVPWDTRPAASLRKTRIIIGIVAVRADTYFRSGLA